MSYYEQMIRQALTDLAGNPTQGGNLTSPYDQYAAEVLGIVHQPGPEEPPPEPEPPEPPPRPEPEPPKPPPRPEPEPPKPPPRPEPEPPKPPPRPEPEPPKPPPQPPTCLVGSTPIATPDGEVELQDLELGDEVITHNGVGVVKAKGSHEVGRIYRITLENDTILECSPDHPLAVSGVTEDLADKEQYVEAKDIKYGDKVLTPDGEVMVEESETLEEDTVVYNLTVESDHTYISAGVYSHNKWPPWPPEPNPPYPYPQPWPEPWPSPWPEPPIEPWPEPEPLPWPETPDIRFEDPNVGGSVFPEEGDPGYTEDRAPADFRSNISITEMPPFGFYDAGQGDVAGWMLPVSQGTNLPSYVAQQSGGPMPPLFQALSQ